MEDMSAGSRPLWEWSMWFVLFFAGFGGSRWPRVLKRILIILAEESEALLGPTASLDSSGLNSLGVWCNWQLTRDGKVVPVLSVGDDAVMRILMVLRGGFLCPEY